jgi:tRNA (guanine-N7-)-methyltransferase
MSRNGKLEKFAENKMFSHVFEPGFYELQSNDFYLKSNWNTKFFNNNNPIVVEFGCGKGEYTVGLAEKYPDKNFIGVDIKGARIWKGARTSFELGLKNVAFLRTRIEFTPKCFGVSEVDEIWITFPDPQLRRKKRVKKRLTSSRFLSYYQHFIKENSIINLKTDDDELYKYTLGLVQMNQLQIIQNIPDLYSCEIEDSAFNVKTFYEKMWLKQGKSIKLLSFKLPCTKLIVEPED